VACRRAEKCISAAASVEDLATLRVAPSRVLGEGWRMSLCVKVSKT
jgi:hypothetical protein